MTGESNFPAGRRSFAAPGIFDDLHQDLRTFRQILRLSQI